MLENNWPRVPVEQSGEASDMMRTGSVPARQRYELIRLAQRQGVVLGGEYRAESHITVGSVAFCGAIAVSADSAVLGVGGITQDGIFAKLLQDATMRASMIAAARRTIVLADSAKFNHKLLGHIASLEQTISWSPMRSLQESYSERWRSSKSKSLSRPL